jgi:hypothetical protein
MERKISPQCLLNLEHIEYHVHWKLKNIVMHSPIKQSTFIYFIFKGPSFFMENHLMALRTLGQDSRRIDHGFLFLQ